MVWVLPCSHCVVIFCSRPFILFFFYFFIDTTQVSFLYIWCRGMNNFGKHCTLAAIELSEMQRDVALKTDPDREDVAG